MWILSNKSGYGKNRYVVGPNDLIISATVLSHRGTLITNNEKDFRRVPGLLVENWLL